MNDKEPSAGPKRPAMPSSQRIHGRSVRDRFVHSPLAFTNVSLVYVWGAVFLLFALWEPNTFLSGTTWKSLLSQQAVTTILALGVVVALAAGVFDLSVGAILGGAAIWIAHLMVSLGIAPVPAALITIGCGALVGCFTAVMVIVFKVNSFIATLGVSSILTAVVSLVSANQDIVGLPQSFQSWATFQILGIDGAFWIAMVIAAVIWFVLEHRPVGRHVYATGGNVDAARLAGVRTNRIVFATIVLTAAISSVAGVVVTSLVGTGSPTIGPPYLLPAFAAAFLGSTQVKPGRYNVIGTLIAVYALATGVEGLQLAGAPDWLPNLFNGVALLLAVALAARRGRLATDAVTALPARATPKLGLRDIAREHIECLRDELQETVRLTVQTSEGTGGKVIEAAESRRSVRVAARPGELLSGDSAEVLALAVNTPSTATPDQVVFREQDDAVFASAPVFDGNRVVAAVSVGAPAARVNELLSVEIAAGLIGAAAKISRDLSSRAQAASEAGEQESADFRQVVPAADRYR